MKPFAPHPTNEAGNPGAGALRRIGQQPAVRRSGKWILDGGLAALAWALTCAMLRHAGPTARGLGLFTLLSLACNLALGLTGQHYRLAGFNEARSLLGASLVIAALSMLFCTFRWDLWFGTEGAEVFLSSSLACGALWFGARILAARLHHRRFLPAKGKGAAGGERTLIVGAGRAGMRLCQELLEHPRLNCRVVGFVDDALEKQGVRIEGVPVLGPTRLLEVFVQEQRASQVILGMAGVGGSRIRELSQRLQGQGIKVRTVPGILDLVGDHPWKPEVRDIAIEDLLRRDAVNLDTGAIRHALEGSVALITGAGGSIGSELCRRVAGFQPSCLVLLGRGENSLWEVERDLRRLFPGQAIAVALCDIRNRARLQQVFDRWRPQVVFHAAAHKHVPYLEMHPEEAIENNIFGTLNVIKACLACATRILVNVSTDKAVNPVNVLGVSKRIGEYLVTRAAGEAPAGSRFLSVRFGNVLGTNDARLAEFCRSYANQGRSSMGAWLQHDRLGHNYRLGEMSAALGRSQLARLEHFLDRRSRVAALYAEGLAAVPGVRAPVVRPDVRMSWFVYVVTLPEGCDRDRTMAAMEREGVPCRGYFAPIHTQPYIRDRFGDLAGTLPRTEAIARRTLALPFHNGLEPVEVEQVLAVLRRNLWAV
jgi:FlaA1/EpsC-like NDP-sugar epimerase